MKKDLVVLLDYYTCQENGVPFDEYVDKLTRALDAYETKVLRDPTTSSIRGDYSRTWAVSRVVMIEGTAQDQEAIFETARQAFLALKASAR